MSAIFSTCGLYRFRLERDVQLHGIVTALFGVNPSTAGETINDATIRKDIGFGKVNGWRRIIKGNVFPFRATDVRELRGVKDHKLAENAEHLLRIAADADLLIPCWGSRDKLPRELHEKLQWTLDILRSTGKPMVHFGLTASGDPKHPLMLGYDTPLTDFRAAASIGRPGERGETE